MGGLVEKIQFTTIIWQQVSDIKNLFIAAFFTPCLCGWGDYSTKMSKTRPKIPDSAQQLVVGVCSWPGTGPGMCEMQIGNYYDNRRWLNCKNRIIATFFLPNEWRSCHLGKWKLARALGTYSHQQETIMGKQAVTSSGRIIWNVLICSGLGMRLGLNHPR